VLKPLVAPASKPLLIQPIGAGDVSDALTSVAVSAPVNGMVELVGPEAIPQDELVRRYFKAKRDVRPVIADPSARYFGTELDDRSLDPSGTPLLGYTQLAEWLS